MSKRWPKGTKNPDKCRHRWQPISIETEHTVYDQAKQRSWAGSGPSLEHAQVTVICLRCASWSYMEMAWAGVRLEGSMDRTPGKWETSNLRDIWAARARQEQAEDEAREKEQEAQQ